MIREIVLLPSDAELHSIITLNYRTSDCGLWVRAFGVLDDPSLLDLDHRMKLAPLVCLFVGFGMIGSQVYGDWSDQVFPIKRHEFGTVAVSSETEYDFPIHNPFKTDLHFRSIRASCGCTTPTIIDQTIPPGGSGTIRAKFNTDTFRGKKGATITVVMDQPFFAEARLRVDGYIRSDMVFHPGSLRMGSQDAGREGSMTTRVAYAGRSNWEIVDVRSEVDWLVPRWTLTQRGGGRVNYDLEVTLREDAPTGFFQRELVVVTNDRNMPHVPLMVTGKVEDAITISPSTLTLGRIDREATTRRMVVVAKSPITVTEVVADDFEFRMEASDSAKRTHILTPSVRYLGKQTGTIRSQAKLRTAEGVEGSFTIVGESVAR